MSQDIRLMKLGRLTDLRIKLDKLSDRAQGIIESIQRATFVLDSLWAIDSGKVKNYAQELDEVMVEGNAVRKQIDDLEIDVGIRF